LKYQMKMNSKLLAFAAGVVLTALLHLAGLWANNKRWESEMATHGSGYWKGSGSQPFEFRWKNQHQPTTRTDWLTI